MTKEEKISKYIIESLNTKELQEKYLNLLNLRIEENRKSLGNIFMIMLITVFAFPLIIETKISEISIGPFKLHDNSFAISIIPSIFAVSYYKYVTIWVDLVEQKNVYRNLTSKILSVNEKSYLNERIKHYSFVDSLSSIHLQEKSKYLGCIIVIIWLPITIGFIFFPFLFEYYTIKTLYLKYGLNKIIDWIFFLTPLLIGLFTILLFIQVIKKEIEKDKEFEKELKKD